jgi:hypothetical protein
MGIFDRLLVMIGWPVQGAVKRRKALMPRMTCPECGNVVAYSARTKLTSAHKCGGAIVQRSITGAW